MAMEVLATWQDEYADLPSASTALAGTANVANFVADMVAGITPDQLTLNTAAGFTFTFNTALFTTGLLAMAATPVTAVGVAAMAAAWQAAILTTIFPVTLNVTAGALTTTPGTPATTFSAVTAVIIDPPSIVLAVAKLTELALSAPTADPLMSDFPVKMREAFALLSITVTGLDSTVPVPIALVAALVPLV